MQVCEREQPSRTHIISHQKRTCRIDGTYGTGGANRRSPRGGLAKGMPRNTHVPLRRNPFTEPRYVCTTFVSGASRGWPCRGADDVGTAAAEAPPATAQANQTSGPNAMDSRVDLVALRPRWCRSMTEQNRIIERPDLHTVLEPHAG